MSDLNNVVVLEEDLLEAVEALIRERPELGYREAADFVNDAVRRFLRGIPGSHTGSKGL